MGENDHTGGVLHTLYYLILIPMVYLAFAVFIGGMAWRLVKIFRRPGHPVTLQIYPVQKPRWLWTLYDTFVFPTVRRHKPVLWFFLVTFHGCLLLLIIGHVELFGDIALLQIVPHHVFLGKGFVGLITAVCLLYFLFRRFLSPVRELSIAEDYYLLVLLLLIVIFGSQMDWARNWYDYGDLDTDDYQLYLWGLLTFQPEIPENVLYSGHAFMLVLHVFFANLFLIFFPFSQAIHTFLSLPMNTLRKGRHG